MDLKQYTGKSNILDQLGNMELLFEAYLTHESTSQPEPDDIPRTKDPVWILGKKYDALKGKFWHVHFRSFYVIV